MRELNRGYKAKYVFGNDYWKKIEHNINRRYNSAVSVIINIELYKQIFKIVEL